MHAHVEYFLIGVCMHSAYESMYSLAAPLP